MLLRGRPRRVLAAPRARGRGDREPRHGPDLAAGRPPCPARKDRSAGCAGAAAGLDGLVARRAAGLLHGASPSPEHEDERRLSRERGTLLKERLRLSNRIKGLCAAQGIYDYEPLGADRRERLARLVTGDGRALPGRLAAEIGRQLDCLELVLRHLAEVEAVRDARAAQARKEGGSKLATLLRLKGIGPEVATVLELEVFHRHFANRRDVAADAGLAPSPYASGGISPEQGNSKAGNRRARKALIELAWLWLRHQPESALARWYRDRVGTATGRVKRIAIVALARKLLVAIWRYVETGLVPAEAAVRT